MAANMHGMNATFRTLHELARVRRKWRLQAPRSQQSNGGV
jgi:hypothetical protein